MFEPANRMSGLHTSVFTDLLRQKDLFEKETGLPVLDFSLGSPDIVPDESVVNALKEAVADPRNYRYAVSAKAQLVTAIQTWYHERYQVDLEDDEILVLQGSQEALVNLPLIFCNPGDLVLVPDPYYPIYVDAPHLAGARIEYMPLLEKNGYMIDLDAIDPETADKAKLMVVNYPNNPTGAIANQAWMEKLKDFACAHNILVIYDNAYSDLVYNGHPAESYLSLPGAKETGVELNSFSKAYGMAGARLGVLVGNKSVLDAYRKLKSNLDYGIFLPIQEAGIAALKSGTGYIENLRKEYIARRNLMLASFKEAGWILPDCEATMFFWAPIPDQYAKSLLFAKDLLAQTGILVTPGTSFGQQGERYVRIAMVQSKEHILEAARRLKDSHFFDQDFLERCFR